MAVIRADQRAHGLRPGGPDEMVMAASALLHGLSARLIAVERQAA